MFLCYASAGHKAAEAPADSANQGGGRADHGWQRLLGLCVEWLSILAHNLVPIIVIVLVSTTRHTPLIALCFHM